jgi:hypothetical protein
MSLFDFLLGRPKATVHVLDFTHPNERFTIGRRVSQRLLDDFAADGQLFASISELKSGALKFFPGFRAGGKTYTFMRKHTWDELDYQYRHPPKNLDEALQGVLKAIGPDTGRIS